MMAETHGAPTPFQAYAYLDIEHPVVAWGVYRGVLVSAQASTAPPNCPVSLMFAGIVHYKSNVRLQNEIIIDAVRASQFPSRTSRLAGMYFFTDSAQAAKAESWGGHFRPENLGEVEVHPVGEVTRVDSDWITYAETDRLGNLDTSDLSWIERYWAGEPHGSTPVWETIVQGRAVVFGTKLRERAYNVLARDFPSALDTLEMARLAAEVGSDLGQTGAWITQSEPDRLRLDYYLDMQDGHNPELHERLRAYGGPRNYRDLVPGKETFGLPDFRPYGRDFVVSQRLHPEVGLPLTTLHQAVVGSEPG